MKEKDIRNNLHTKIILGAGMLLRLFYVVFSTIYDRQYDIGMIDLSAGKPVSGGHLGYIQYIFTYMELPKVDPTTVYQFHHPPVSHFISAVWMKIVSIFTGNLSVIEESIQVVPFICSLIILWAAWKIAEELKIGEKGESIVVSIFAFHPALILLSGSVNNDCMSLMFTMLVILYMLKWISVRSFKNILLMAVFLGLGISTKQNVAELAFPIGMVFLYFLIKKFDKKLVLEYISFAIVSIPIGIWFYIRNLIKYDMSLLWVYELPEDSWQYTGNIPLIYRFLIPNPKELIDNLIHFRIGCGYNVWMQIIRTSVLGEWDMAEASKMVKILAIFLMLAGAVLALIAFISMVRTMIMGKLQLKTVESSLNRIFLVGSYIVVMFSYLLFAYKYPQECSMNYRYIVITLLMPALGLGYLYDAGDNNIFVKLVNAVVVVFSLLSVAMTIIWCFI